MQKNLNLKTTYLVSSNEFTKQFKIDDIDLFIHKTFDEDSNLHFIVACIPFIKEVSASDIKYPIAFELERERNKVFKKFSCEDSIDFIDKLIEQVKENDKNKVVI
jgi:hypothetical protein